MLTYQTVLKPKIVDLPNSTSTSNCFQPNFSQKKKRKRNRWFPNICSYSKVFTLTKTCLCKCDGVPLEEQDLHALYLHNLLAKDALEIFLTKPNIRAVL